MQEHIEIVNDHIISRGKISMDDMHKYHLFILYLASW